MDAGAILERVLPHVVRRGFLEPAEHDALLDWAIGQEDAFAASRLGGGGVDAGVRNSLSLPGAVLAQWEPVLVERMRAALPGLCENLGMLAFAAGRVELQMVAYRDGGFYRRHRDIAYREDRPGVRALSGVYYLHGEPRGYSGGALRLHAIGEGSAAFADVEPQANALVAFPAWAPHEVLPVSCPSGAFADARFAINFWVHVAA